MIKKELKTLSQLQNPTRYQIRPSRQSEEQNVDEILSFKKRFIKDMKLDEWDWSIFKFKLISLMLNTLILGSIMYPLVNKSDNLTYVESLSYMCLGLASPHVLIFLIPKLWALIPYITCWLKFIGIIISLIVFGSIFGVMGLGDKFDKIMTFFCDKGISNRERRVMQSTFKE